MTMYVFSSSSHFHPLVVAFIDDILNLSFVYVIVDLLSYSVQLVIILYYHYLLDAGMSRVGRESPFMQAPVCLLHALLIP